jgi:iron complex outermembrane recepter protein
MSSRGFATALGAAAISLHATSFADPEASASANDAGGLEEVVVTAQRRTESLQNVGIAISVLSGQSLADKSITFVNDLQNATPSLQIQGSADSGQGVR